MKTFKRRDDGKIFTLKLLSHWSDIESDDGEQDCVKWYGGSKDGDLFVSASKGFSYVLISQNKV